MSTDDDGKTRVTRSAQNPVLADTELRDDTSSPETLGDFVLGPELGRGGMGVVFEARHRDSETTVALKRLLHVSQAAIRALRDEFRSLAELSHPNLIRLIELDTHESPPYFTMELVHGMGFLDYVRGSFDSQDSDNVLRYDEGRLEHAIRQIAEGIMALHQANKLHRDIKPSNVLVTLDHRVVLVDFGLAVDVNPQDDVYRNSMQERAGTPFYMSPEQHAGQQLSYQSDWYSLGVLIFEAVTGALPFEAPTFSELFAKKMSDSRPAPRDLNADVPQTLNDLCCALLDPLPENRPRGAEILARLGSASAPQATKRVWVGRSSALSNLQDALQQVHAGIATTAFVSGPPGTGKSALVDKFLELARSESRYVVLRGRCYENESVPYKGFDGVVDALARYWSREPMAQAEALVPLDLNSLCRIFPVLEDVPAVRHAFRPAEERTPDPQEMRRRGLAALGETLARLALREQLIIFVDDLHWGDGDTAALFQQLTRQPTPVRCLLIAAFRDGSEAAASRCIRAIREKEQPERHQREFARQIEIAIDALDDEETLQLAEQLVGCETVEARQRAAALAMEAAGNPLFVKILAQDMDERDVPHRSLEEVLWSRIQRLPTDQRAFVELVAIAGRPVSSQLVYQATGSTEHPSLMLRNLLVERFVRQVGGAATDHVEAYHDRIRETALARIDAARMAEGSERLARVALASGEFDDPEFIARLLRRAGKRNEAAGYAWVAAQEANQQLAFTQAVELYQEALEGLDPDAEQEIELRIGLAAALASAGRGADAAAQFQFAADRAHGDRALDWRCQAALRYLTSGHINEGLTAIKTVLDDVGMPLPQTRSQALWSLLLQRAKLALTSLRSAPADPASLTPRQRKLLDYSWSAAAGLNVVDPVVASAYVTRNLRLALAAGVPEYLTRALAAQAAHSATTGRRSRRQVARFLHKMRQVARHEGGPYGKAKRELARGVTAHLHGRWRAAHRSCDRATRHLSHPDCHDVAWELDTAQTFAMWALMYEGNIAELTRRQPALLRIAQENDDLFGTLNFGSVVRTYVLLSADQPGEARQRLADEEELLSDQGFFVQHHNWLLGSTFLELYVDQPMIAWQRIAHRWTDYERSMLSWVEQVRIDFLQVQGRAAVAAAAADAAVGTGPAKRIVHRLRKEKADWATAIAELLDGGIATVEGQQAQAVAHFGQAAIGLERARMYLHAAAAYRRLGELVQDEDGLAHAQKGTELMLQLGITDAARMTRAMAPAAI